MADPRKRWRVRPGTRPRLGAVDTHATAGAPGDKAQTAERSAELVVELAELQGRLWAEHRRALLLVLQAIDAGGKDGTIRKVFTGVNPQGVRVSSFKGPTLDELAHDFLWRIHRQTPAAGEIGVFNRSHYEDVLITRVDQIVPEAVWRPRYQAIRQFEAHLEASGTTVVKCFLHISKDEQAKRFRARLDDPSKRWKFAQADLDVREKWDDYQKAFADAIGETSTGAAPWYVVPADRKWYRDWAVLQILVGTLRDLDPQYPPEEEGLDAIVIT
ncbi:MAG: polyphosphate kinase 2 family protein [Acidimicrobiales bacterium]